MGEHIYYGPWVNWAHGPLVGATLTLGDRSGALLTAFIATFVTLAGAQLFKILIYIFHQTRSRRSAQDGLYHQQQVIFRNTPTPGGAAWSFLMQWWTWSGKARFNFARTIPWAIFCLSYMLIFAVAAVFSSDIAKGPGSARLVMGDTCGYWEADGDGTSLAALRAYAERVANQSLASASYARSCYGGANDVLSCGKYTKPSISFTVNKNASCPFADEMCQMGDTSAYEITTQKIDSLYDLGINSRHSDRLQVQKIATCSPIVQKGFGEVIPGGNLTGGYDTDHWYTYYYGPSKYGESDVNSSDYTHRYNDHTWIDGVGYQLSAYWHLAGPLGVTGGWDPIPEVNRTDADVTFLFLSQNGISYSEAVDDPFFSAHYSMDLTSLVEGAIYYQADNYVTVMGCTDQYKVCNPENDKCTPAGGINQILPWIALNGDDLGLNTIQQALSLRLIRTAATGAINNIVFALGESALQAKDLLVQGKMSSPLPNNQWQIEMESWVNKGLADLQIQTVEYATGPQSVVAGAHVNQPWADKDVDAESEALNLVAKAMCYSQMINDTTDTVSFSILGMAILFSIGGLIILISLFIDLLVGWIQRRFNIGTHARMCWLLDDKLQLHRYLNQELGHGQWSGDVENMPTTVVASDFQTLAVAHEKGTGDEKVHVQVYSSPQYSPAPEQPTQGAYPKYTKVVAEENWSQR